MCCINSQWFSTYQFEWVDQTSWWGTSVLGCRQSRSEWRTRPAPASTCHHLNELWLGPAVYCPREITLWYHLNWPKEKKNHRYFLIKTIYNIHFWEIQKETISKNMYCFPHTYLISLIMKLSFLCITFNFLN